MVENDPTNPNGTTGNDGGGGTTPWWQDPSSRPAGYSGPWPPPLPPGAQYGTVPGSIVYPNGGPTGTVPTPNPGDYGNPSPPPPTPPPPTGTPNPPGTGGPPPTSTTPPPTRGPVPVDRLTPEPDPVFGPPSYPTPPPRTFTKFGYGEFEQPTLNDLFADDGFKFRLKTGTDSLERSAAARGVLNTGGTLKDVLGYGQDLASTEFQNMWDRKFNTYQTNRGNAFQGWLANEGLSGDVYKDNVKTQYTDPFDRQYQGARDAFDSRQHNTDQNRYYQTRGDEFDRTFDFNKHIQDFYEHRTDRNDDFYRRYTLLGLL